MLLTKPYINQRGYIIRKNGNSETLLNSIREELTVKPQVYNMYDKDIESFSVCLENKKKMYIPKFYGMQLYQSHTLI